MPGENQEITSCETNEKGNQRKALACAIFQQYCWGLWGNYKRLDLIIRGDVFQSVRCGQGGLNEDYWAGVGLNWGLGVGGEGGRSAHCFTSTPCAKGRHISWVAGYSKPTFIINGCSMLSLSLSGGGVLAH